MFCEIKRTHQGYWQLSFNGLLKQPFLIAMSISLNLELFYFVFSITIFSKSFIYELIHTTKTTCEYLRGPGLPSLKLNVDANIPNGNAPMPKENWKFPSPPNPKFWKGWGNKEKDIQKPLIQLILLAYLLYFYYNWYC